MKKIFSIFLLLFCLSCFGSTLSLKESLASAEPGSYLVMQQGKNYDFLYIRDKTERHLVLEEISVPNSNFTRANLSWKVWFEQGGPGHTLWTVSHINLESGQFEEIYSFTHHGWVNLSEDESFLSTLLNLSFSDLALEDRKKVGLAPGRTRVDTRPFWNPKVYYEGRPLNSVAFKAYKAQWPHDKTEMSDRSIEVYIPAEGSKCPSFFPFWVEVEGRLGNAKMRVVDSGRGAHSPRGSYPKRPVSLKKGATMTKGGLSFEVKASEASPKLAVTAVSEDRLIALPFPLNSTESKEGESRTVTIDPQTLKQWLNQGETYTFSIEGIEAGRWFCEQFSTIA